MERNKSPAVLKAQNGKLALDLSNTSKTLIRTDTTIKSTLDKIEEAKLVNQRLRAQIVEKDECLAQMQTTLKQVFFANTRSYDKLVNVLKENVIDSSPSNFNRLDNLMADALNLSAVVNNNIKVPSPSPAISIRPRAVAQSYEYLSDNTDMGEMSMAISTPCMPNRRTSLFDRNSVPISGIKASPPPDQNQSPKLARQLFATPASIGTITTRPRNLSSRFLQPEESPIMKRSTVNTPIVPTPRDKKKTVSDNSSKAKPPRATKKTTTAKVQSLHPSTSIDQSSETSSYCEARRRLARKAAPLSGSLRELTVEEALKIMKANDELRKRRPTVK